MDPHHMSTLRYDLRRTEDELRQASRAVARGVFVEYGTPPTIV